MTIHPSDEEALQTIDAAMFSGCPDEEFLQRLEYFIKRWNERIPGVRDLNRIFEAESADDGEST